jgi:hypothetical protein
LEKFVDWLLWGLAHGHNVPDIESDIDDYWYRTFNLGLFYLEPADHWADIAAEYIGNGSGYFPTPGDVVAMMVKMTFGGEPTHEHKTKSVLDPCTGTGIMLLYASNYSLNLHGVDIHPLLCKIALVNAYVYVPWLVVRPKHLTMFDQGIIEMELPTGIKIPKCLNCNGKEFLVDVVTNQALEVSEGGMVRVTQSGIGQDVIANKLTPENITCARCFHEYQKENQT